MGLRDFLEERDEKNTAKIKNQVNENLAKRSAENFKNRIVERYSAYGDVVELEDGRKLLGRYYCHRGKSIGYRRLYACIGYEKFETVTHSDTDYYVSGYSGTISSSGNVDLSPDYSSVTTSWESIEKRDKVFDAYYYVKPVERGKKDTVVQLEKKFFEKGGDLYSRVKNNERIYRSKDPMDPKSCFRKIINTRRVISFVWLFVFLLLFTRLVSTMQGMGGIMSVLNSSSANIGAEIYDNYFSTNFPIVVMVAGAIGTILLLIIYQYVKDKAIMFDLKDSSCAKFIISFVVILILNIYFMQVSVWFIFLINILGVVLSLIFVIKCVGNNGKNDYARMWKFLNDPTRMSELERLAVEIDSYTQSAAYGSNVEESFSEGKGTFFIT